MALQSVSQAAAAPGTVQTASVGDGPGVTNLRTGPAKYDAAIQKLLIPGINFNLSCPTGLRVTWTSGQPGTTPQQPVNAQGAPLLLYILRASLALNRRSIDA